MNGFTYILFKKTFSLFIPNIFTNTQSRNSALIAIILIVIDIIVASLLLPYFSKQVAQSFASTLFAGLSISLLFFGILWTLEKIIGHLQDIIFFPAINNNIQTITYRVVAKIHQIPLSAYQNLSVPELINAIRRISLSARSFVKIFFLLLIPAFIKVLIALNSSLQFGNIAFILIPSFVLCIGILYKGTQWYVSTRERSWQLTDKVIMRIHDGILNTKISRFYLEEEMNTITSLLKQEAKLWHNTNTRLHLVHIFIALVLGSSFTLILYQVFQGVLEKNLTIGDFLLLKTQLIAAFLPFKQLSTEFRQLAEASIDIKKIIHILDLQEENYLKPETSNNLSAQAFTQVSTQSFKNNSIKGISCYHLNFGYSKDNLILENVSFNIMQGEKVAILGNNGSGKSSLLRLLGGLLPPEQGEIRIHGRNIQQYSRKSLSKILHYIPQDLRLFNLSLRENMGYGTQNCPDSLILSAMETVGLSPLLEQLPEGLDSKVGELGSLLSGGEVQRIALARAMILQPEILLLDETLHSLNMEDERNLLENLCVLIPTIVLVSHRPSTLHFVDKSYKILNGRIFESTRELAYEEH